MNMHTSMAKQPVALDVQNNYVDNMANIVYSGFICAFNHCKMCMWMKISLI